MLGSEPGFGPTGSGCKLHFDEESQGLVAPAILHNSFQLMSFAHDSHRTTTREGAVRQYLREPFTDLFQIAQHGLSSPAIGTRNEYQLGTQMTADRFRIVHNFSSRLH
jgi:hypothetical protein